MRRAQGLLPGKAWLTGQALMYGRWIGGVMLVGDGMWVRLNYCRLLHIH
jgi:hypothetical protein